MLSFAFYIHAEAKIQLILFSVGYFALLRKFVLYCNSNQGEKLVIYMGEKWYEGPMNLRGREYIWFY